MKYILFDFDGTLANNQEGITKSVRYALESLGLYDGNEDGLLRFIGPPLLQSFQTFYRLDDKLAAQCVVKYRERFAEKGVYECALYPGVQQMLQNLIAAGKQPCIASSKPQCFVEQILDMLHIRSFFSVIVGATLDSSLVEKADVIRVAIQQLPGANASNTIMVGDRCYDVEGAIACGLNCVGVRYGFAPPGELESAGAVFLADDIAMLERYLIECKSYAINEENKE